MFSRLERFEIAVVVVVLAFSTWVSFVAPWPSAAKQQEINAMSNTTLSAARAATPAQESAQNEHIQRGLQAASQCVDLLVARDFTVLSVRVSGRNPVIEIQRCTQCNDLAGVMTLRTPTPQGPKNVITAVLLGCQVQWIA